MRLTLGSLLLFISCAAGQTEYRKAPVTPGLAQVTQPATAGGASPAVEWQLAVNYRREQRESLTSYWLSLTPRGWVWHDEPWMDLILMVVAWDDGTRVYGLAVELESGGRDTQLCPVLVRIQVDKDGFVPIDLERSRSSVVDRVHRTTWTGELGPELARRLLTAQDVQVQLPVCVGGATRNEVLSERELTAIRDLYIRYGESGHGPRHDPAKVPVAALPE